MEAKIRSKSKLSCNHRLGEDFNNSSQSSVVDFLNIYLFIWIMRINIES